jgi:hypothetical protein
LAVQGSVCRGLIEKLQMIAPSLQMSLQLARGDFEGAVAG